MPEEEMYGYFPGGDPRRFRPDVETATIEEIADWKEMCRVAAEEEKHGGRMSCPPAHQAGDVEYEGEKRAAWINTGRFGPGSWYEEAEEEVLPAEILDTICYAGPVRDPEGFLEHISYGYAEGA